MVDPKFWGVGNGWVAAGMARVIESMPGEMSEGRAPLAGYTREVRLEAEKDH